MWWLIVFVILAGPGYPDIWSNILDISVKGVFWMRLTIKLVDLGKHITFNSVDGLIKTVENLNKDWPSFRKKEFCQ